MELLLAVCLIIGLGASLIGVVLGLYREKNGVVFLSALCAVGFLIPLLK